MRRAGLEALARCGVVTDLARVAPHCPRCGTPGPCSCDERLDQQLADRRARARARRLELAVRETLARIGWSWCDDHTVFERAVCVPHLRAIADRWTPDRGSLLVLGSTGAGKTSACARALRRLVRTAKSPEDLVLGVTWTSASSLAHARRRHRIGAGEAPCVEAATAAPILVLDELGPEQLGSDAIGEILDARYQRAAVTITTSGMRIEELVGKYGSAVVRRLTAPFGATVEAWT